MTPLPVCRSVLMVDSEVVAGSEELRGQVMGASDLFSCKELRITLPERVARRPG